MAIKKALLRPPLGQGYSLIGSNKPTGKPISNALYCPPLPNSFFGPTVPQNLETISVSDYKSMRIPALRQVSCVKERRETYLRTSGLSVLTLPQ